MRIFRLFLPGLLVILLSAGLSAGSHNDITDISCLDCHKMLPFNKIADKFSDSADRTCMKCHSADMAGFSHPVGIKVGVELPDDMPLGDGRRMMCITCHTFHSTTYINLSGEKKRFLRRAVTGRNFCASCHKTDTFQVH